MVDDENKFKLLYELIYAEYNSEIARSKKVEEKAVRLFTVLNIIFPLLLTVILKYQFWKELQSINVLITSVLIFLFVVIFCSLIFAWFELFKNLRNKKIAKIDLTKDNEFEDIVYDDSKDMSYLYWKIYKTCQKAIEDNKLNSNELYQSLEKAQDWIKRAFSLFCIFLLILFFCYLHKVYT